MRFFISSELNRNDLLKLIILLTLIFFIFLWLTNILLYLKIGFSYESIVDYYRGNEEAFRPPRSYLGLLEESHFHLFSMAIILITINHLMLFANFSSLYKLLLVITSFGSAFFDILSGWLIRYISPLFAYLKLGSFFVLQVSMLLIFIIIFVYLFKNNDN